MLGLFFDSWNLFPQFMAKVETANEDRITIELPTKWDDAPLGVILRALLRKVSLSKAGVAVTVWATDSMVMLLGCKVVLVRSSAASAGAVWISVLTNTLQVLICCVLSDSFPDPFLFAHLWTPQTPHLIPLSSLVSYCVNGIKNSKPMPEEG